jgi:hypothetical protein
MLYNEAMNNALDCKQPKNRTPPFANKLSAADKKRVVGRQPAPAGKPALIVSPSIRAAAFGKYHTQ